MIKANYDEDFTLTVAVVSEDGMVTGLTTVTFEIWDDDENNLIDSGTMVESSKVLGIYIYTTHITKSEYDSYGTLYRVYFETPAGITDGAEDIMINDDLYELVRENRHYNLSVENVLVLAAEIPNPNPRNITDNTTNFVKTRIKAEGDANWDSADVHYVYAWYKVLGDKIPYKMGKRDSSEPAFPYYTGEA